MDLTIEIPDEIGAALTVGEESTGHPLETGYGMWAKYIPAPSAEEIDENRREMFRNFGQDF